MPASIWDLAAEKVREPNKRFSAEIDTENTTETEIKEKERQVDQTYVIACGSKDCGKSSLILRFLDRDDQPKPTVALEYTYGRRTRGNTKDVGHLWELGGGQFLANLLEIPINANTIADTSIVIMLDLSQPDTLWNTLETLLTVARRTVDKALVQLKHADAALWEHVTQQMALRIADHGDRELLKPFPTRLALVGGKYDVFQDFESEKKKIICKTLRFMAHMNGASLQFFSTKIESLVSRGRALISQFAFNTSPSKGMSVDYNKPLFVPFGSDSFEEIGPPPLDDPSQVNVHANDPAELWKSAFDQHFPPKDTKMEVRDDPAKDPQYREEAIDRLRAQKDQELERYIRQKKGEMNRQETVGAEKTVPKTEEKEEE